MEMHKAHILVVDDDTRLRALLQRFLQENGFRVSAAKGAAEARMMLKQYKFDLLIVDIMMPEESGLEFLAGLRKEDNVPVILLTAMGETGDRIAGLESGADDYLGKPFALKEVQARLNALIRRSGGQAAPVIRHGKIEFDPQTRKVRQDGKETVLAPKELALLELLLLNKNRVLSKETIENKIYSWDEEVSSNAVEVHIHHLRKKLGRDIVKTVNKIGYILGDE